MLNLSEVERAYLAGLFDGEGCLGYYYKGALRYHLASVAIYNCDIRIMLWLKERLPFGNFCNTNNEKFVLQSWICNSRRQVELFLKTIRPYLVIKADQVDLLLSLWDTEQKIRRSRRLSEEVLALRHNTMLEMKRLKTANYKSVPLIQTLHTGTCPDIKVEENERT